MIENKTFLENITKAVEDAIKEEAGEILKRHKKEMSEELDNKMKEVVVRTGLKLASFTRLQDFGHELIITLQDKETK